jgi:hypothetical protein
MRDPLNKLAEGQKKQMVRPRPGMMFRGMLKVVLIAIAASQILTTAFTLLAHQIDPALSPEIISVFGFVTCGLVSMWLQADARDQPAPRATASPDRGLRLIVRGAGWSCCISN